MPLIATAKSDFKPAPAGTHLAVCVQVIDIGTQHSKFYDKWSHKVLIGWELPEELDDKGEPFLVYKRYTLSLSKKATLRTNLEAWRGRAFSEEELKGFDLKNILGKPCLLSLIHNDSDGATYANVEAVASLTKGMALPKAKGDLVFFSLPEWDQSVFDKFSDHLKETINSSSERKGQPKPDQGEANGKSPIGPVGRASPMAEEDIPF